MPTESLKGLAAAYPGVVTYCARDLGTGRAWAQEADRPVRTASVIKVPIMVEAFAQAADGRCDWARPLRLDRANAVGGSGVLQDLSDGLTLTLRDAVVLMIVLSDNTATNLVLDALDGGPAAVNARMRTLGLPQTTVFRRAFSPDDPDSPDGVRYGLGRTTAREAVSLLAGLAHGQIVSPVASAEMIRILGRQTDRDGIGRLLPAGAHYAGKSGRLPDVRNDAGLVFVEDGRGPLALAVFCDGQPPSPTDLPDDVGLWTIARLADGFTTELGVP